MSVFHFDDLLFSVLSPLLAPFQPEQSGCAPHRPRCSSFTSSVNAVPHLVDFSTRTTAVARNIAFDAHRLLAVSSALHCGSLLVSLLSSTSMWSPWPDSASPTKILDFTCFIVIYRHLAVRDGASHPAFDAAEFEALYGSRFEVSHKEAPDDETPRFTSFFNVRKRLSSSFPDKCDEIIGKKRTNIITGVRAVTPNEPYPSDSPISCLGFSAPRPRVPSPPKRARVTSAFGDFDSLGTYEVHDFMSTMPMKYFANLALSSREWFTCITNYVESATFRKRFVAMTKDHEMEMNINDPFIDAGELLKSLTVSLLPSDRVDKLLDFIEGCYAQVNTQEGWGRLIRKFSERWAYHEMAKIVRAFKTIGNGRFTKLMRAAVRSTPGVQAESEMEVRRLARCFFLAPLTRNNATSSEKQMAAFWLSSILRSLTSVQCQGRFCMIVFGPTVIVDGVERVSWRDLVENPVTSAAQAETNLKPLATAISALASLRDLCGISSSAFVWTNVDIFNLIEEITTFPDPWFFDIFVALLMQKSSLLSVAVCTRIIHGHRDEAGQIINSMKTLLYRWNMDVAQSLGRPFRYILSQLDVPNKRALVAAIFESHVAQCRDLLFGNGDQASYDEEMWAHQAFLPLLFEASDSMR